MTFVFVAIIYNRYSTLRYQTKQTKDNIIEQTKDFLI